MRSLLSKFFLVAFIVVFSVPLPLFAQTGSWTPPSGPPLGNNTPSPINVSGIDQTKVGGIGSKDGIVVNPTDAQVQNIPGGFISNLSSNINGLTVFNTSPFQSGNPGYNVFVNFLNSSFLNNVTIGQQGTVGPELNIFGKLKYIPRTSSGGVSPSSSGFANNAQQPQPGYVLTALDNQGTIAWGPASGLPPGTNAGDTLIWDTDCQCWTVGPVTNVNSTNLPPGSAGQTMWYNGTTNAWEATDKIKHDTFTAFSDTGQLLTLGRTTLSEPGITLAGSNNVTIAGNRTLVQSPGVSFGTGFGTTPQEVNFSQYSTVRIQKDAGQGRIPYSSDTLGSLKWNQNLTYTNATLGNIPVGKLSLKNPDENTVALFQNEGLSSLIGDVVVSQNGDLYLQGVSSAHWTEMGQGIIQPLCYVTTTGKVVTCTDDPITDVPSTPGFDWTNLPTDYERLITYDDFTNPQNPQVSYTFSANQTVTIEWCGGGSGGGGGGIGGGQSGPFDYDNELPADGGGGGGGGKAGSCQTLSVPVAENDVLTWNIGPGGAGGNGGVFRNAIPTGLPGGGTAQGASSINANSVATAGQVGGATSVYLNGVQIGQTQIGGGAGGNPGFGANNTPTSFSPTYGGYNGGNGANQTLPASSLTWHNGGPGSSNGYQGGGPNGGWGGDGESPSGDVSGTIPSAGGHRGQWGQVTMPGGVEGFLNGYGPGNISNRYGGNGQKGAPGHGGGGGAGGYGQTARLYSGYNSQWEGYTVYQRKGGNGGDGGGGYVKISGLYSSTGSSGVEEATPGPHQFALSNIPIGASTVNIEVWGAGGGGGGRRISVGNLPNGNFGGGGGAGGYAKIQSVPVMQLCPGAANATECRQRTITLSVGQGGAEGQSDFNAFSDSGVTSGSTGQSSAIIASTPSGPVNLVVSGGGQGGQRAPGGNVPAAGGLGGLPSINITGGTTVGTQQGAQGGVGQGGVGINNHGTGGEGAVHNNNGVNHEAGPGAPGRIKISW